MGFGGIWWFRGGFVVVFVTMGGCGSGNQVIR